MPRPAIPPRILTAEEAAHYCGFKGARGRFDGWRKEVGIETMPRSQNLYDVRDLDAAIDREKGIAAALPPGKIKWAG